jgi:hypothetical protein
MNVQLIDDGQMQPNSLLHRDLHNLDSIIDDGECTDIVCYYALEYIQPHLVSNALHNFINKLGTHGTLTIIGVDLRLIAASLYKQNLKIEDAVKLLYSDSNFNDSATINYPNKRNLLSAVDITESLSQFGMKLIQSSILEDMFSYEIKFIKTT